MTSYENQQNNQRGNNSRSNNQRYPGGGNNRIVDLPNGYLASGYYEDSEKKVMRLEYIIKYPKEIVRKIKVEKNKNKNAQLRRFYGYVVHIKESLRQPNITYKEMEAKIKHLPNLTAYAKQRGHISDYFQDFIEKNVHSIHDEKDFAAFAMHFEAIIGNLPKKD